jgi:hypothetical protein
MSLPKLTFPGTHQNHGEAEDGEEAKVTLKDM